MKVSKNRLTLLVCVAFGVSAVVLACGSERPDAAGDGKINVGAPTSCETPNLGCPCATEGATAACGEVKQQIGTFVECSMGRRTCVAGKWGECNGDLIVKKTVSSLRTAALQEAGVACGAANPCDPYCYQYTDTPDPSAIPGDAGLELADGGITLSGGGGGGGTCTSLTIAPATATVTITDFFPFTTSPASTQFTPTFAPAGCVPPGTQPTWTVDRADLATINVNGQLTVFGGTAGTGIMKVQAFFGALVSNAVPVDVIVRAKEESSVAPNVAAPGGQLDKFWSDPAHTVPAPGVTPSDVFWLYPYEDTVFPLALPAPVIMYKMGGNPGNTVKVGLRFPSGSTVATSTFEASIIVKENACTDATQCWAAAPNKDPQIVIPPAMWRAFEQTAQGQDADIYLQRWDSSQLQVENVRRIHFAPGQLKGTVWYNSYSSGLVGNTGAVLKINPGATAPTVGIQIGGKCVTCHSMNMDGTRTIANGYRYPSGGGFLDSQLFNTGAPPTGTPPLTQVLRNYNNGGGTPNPGIRFNYAAPRTDGTVYLTHGGGSGGDPNWRAPAAASQFWNPQTMASITVSGWPANIQAVTPRFAPVGNKIAFGFWAGNNLAQSPSGTLAPNASARTIAVVDFTCAGSPCTSGTVSNARNVTPGMTQRLGWPTFTPDGNSVVFQRQIVSSIGNLSGGWSPSHINSVAGAQADLWITNVPANSSTAATPTQMKAANGLTAAGARYLPEVPRDVNPALPAFHVEGQTFAIKQADSCGNNGTATNVSDTRLNYLPSVAPVEAGGMHWVVFTSRRMYGNIATHNPWDPEPTTTCDSGTPQTKKLWVAAVDKTWTPGTDPSHPAFYLPGQELVAGNSAAYWVNQACGTVGATCSVDADCCQTPTATSCRIDLPATNPVTRSCQPASACLPAGATCTTDADCCGTPAVRCLGTGTKVCAASASYSPASFTRDFVASCTPGYTPVWQSFTWQAEANAPATSIDFAAQTGPSFSALGAAVPIGSATSPTLAPSWATSPTTVDQALEAAVPAQTSQAVLRVTITLNTDGSAAPTLYAWRQFYDCVPNE